MRGTLSKENLPLPILLAVGTLVVSLLLFYAGTTLAAPGINEKINFQGKVVNTDGTNVTDGSYDFEFKLYTVSSGGTAIWTETWNSGTSQVAVNDGIFQVYLGTQQSLSAIDFNQDTLYLSVNFNGDGEMTPRIRLTAAPYAFNAQKFEGQAGSYYLDLDNQTGTCANCLSTTEINESTFTGLNSTNIDDIYLLNSGDTATGDYNFDANTFVIDSAADRVGIGTASPNSTLELSQTTPELRLTNSGTLEYARVDRTAASNLVSWFNRVSQPGVNPFALEFDGDDEVQVSDSTTIRLVGGGFTARAWVYLNSAASSTSRMIVEKISSTTPLLSDTFTGTDGTSLTAHSPDIPGSGFYVSGAEGGFQIAEANNAESLVSNHTASVFDVGTASVDVSVDITWPNPVAGGDGGIALNHGGQGGADRYNYYALRTADNGALLRIVRQRDGVILSQKAFAITSGTHVFRGTRDNSGNISFYVDGNLELTATDTTETGTFHGLDGFNPQGIRWDNLEVKDFYERDWNFGINTTRNLTFKHEGEDSGSYASTGTVPLAAWTHVQMSVDQTNNLVYFAIGGTVESQAFTSSFGAESSYDGVLRIGFDSGQSPAQENFDGRVDELELSDTVRNTANFTPQTTKLSPDANTQALWHFDEGTGTSAADSSGNGNTGTLSANPNDPAWVTGHVTDPGVTVEATVWSSQNGVAASEGGIQKFGYASGGTWVQGQTQRFYIGGTEMMRLSAAGFLGIGTTDPDSKFHLVGGDLYVAPDAGYTFDNPSANEDLYVFGNLEVDGTLFTAGQTIAGHLLPAADDTYDLGSATLRWRDLYLGPSSLNIYRFTGADAEYFTIGYDSTVIAFSSLADGTGTARNFNFAGGRVGIGTVAPKGRLHVYSATAGTVPASVLADELILENSDNVGLSLHSPDANYGYIIFGSPSDNDHTLIYSRYNTGLFLQTQNNLTIFSPTETVFNENGEDNDFRVEAVGEPNALFVQGSDGNVGIGTASPDGTLHVHTASAGTVTAHSFYDDLVVENASDAGISILTPDASYGGLIFGSPSSNLRGWVKYYGNSDILQFGQGGGDHTWLLANQMQFQQETSITTTTGNLTLDSFGTLVINDNLDLSNAAKTVTLASAADALNFDSDTLSIDALNDRVGIGTNAPQAPLHVAGTEVVLGAGEGGTPTATTVRGAAASGTDISGADLTFDASNGTGTGGSGALVFRTAPPTDDPPAVDTVTTQTQNLGTSMSFSHTTSGTNRLLIVALSLRASQASTITYGVDSMTNIRRDQSGDRRTELWYLVNPATGANTVSITGAAEMDDLVATAISFTNVNQSTPLGTDNGATGTGSGEFSVAVSSALDELVVDVATIYPAGGGASTLVVGSGQTERWNTGTGDNNIRGAGSTERGNTTTTMSWTTTTADTWAISAVPIKPAGTGGVQPDPFAERLRITNTGNVGIGRTPATNALEVEGTASKTLAGDWLANSDIRIKTDIQTVENALEVLDRLRPVRFKYTEEYMAAHPGIRDQYYYNFIAQEFQEVFPDAVQDSGEGYLQLDAYVVRPYLVAAVQELNLKVQDLEAQIDSSGSLACDKDSPCQLPKVEAKEGWFAKLTITGEMISPVLEVENLKAKNVESEQVTTGETVGKVARFIEQISEEITVTGKIVSPVVEADTVKAQEGWFNRITVAVEAAFNHVKAQTLDVAGKLVAKTAEIADAGIGRLTAVFVKAEKVEAGKVSIDELTVTGEASGFGIILAGNYQLTVDNSQITETSRVFITFRDPHLPARQYWVSKIIVEDDPATLAVEEPGFVVTLDLPVAQDARFDYWIVNWQDTEIKF